MNPWARRASLSGAARRCSDQRDRGPDGVSFGAGRTAVSRGNGCWFGIFWRTATSWSSVSDQRLPGRADVRAGRPDMPRPLARAVRTEAGHRCAIPTCRATSGLQIHHIDDWAKVQEHDFRESDPVLRQLRPNRASSDTHPAPRLFSVLSSSRVLASSAWAERPAA